MRFITAPLAVLPAAQCVDNTCSLLIAAIQGDTGDGTLSEREVKAFMTPTAS